MLKIKFGYEVLDINVDRNYTLTPIFRFLHSMLNELGPFIHLGSGTNK